MPPKKQFGGQLSVPVTTELRGKLMSIATLMGFSGIAQVVRKLLLEGVKDIEDNLSPENKVMFNRYLAMYAPKVKILGDK